MAKPMREVFCVNDRTNGNTGEVKTYWTRIGVAFHNSDGSDTLRLDAMPLNGTLIVRDSKPKDGGK